MSLNFKGNSYDGIIWNKLIRHIQTPYVFLGLDILQFDESINFERMVSSPPAWLQGCLSTFLWKWLFHT